MTVVASEGVSIVNSKTSLNVQIVSLSGRLDSYTISESRKLLEAALKLTPPNIVVDMQEVSFADSTALSALVTALKRSRELNGDLRLCCLRQPVRMIFELTRLDKVFEIYSTEQEAVHAFGE
jgi:anti-sigma B factor antagonist